MNDDLFNATKRETQPAIKRAAERKSVDDLLMEATMEAEYQPRLNIERVGETLWRAANAADRIIRVVKIIEEAKKGNPRGLPF